MNNRNMSNLYVYLMRSRNKDNKNVPEFKERCFHIDSTQENLWKSGKITILH